MVDKKTTRDTTKIRQPHICSLCVNRCTYSFEKINWSLRVFYHNNLQQFHFEPSKENLNVEEPVGSLSHEGHTYKLKDPANCMWYIDTWICTCMCCTWALHVQCTNTSIFSLHVCSTHLRRISICLHPGDFRASLCRKWQDSSLIV